MTKSEKKKFVRMYLGTFRDQFEHLLEGDLIPDNWDGFEIRAWLAEKMKNDADGYMKHLPMGRRREFRNTVNTWPGL